MNKTPSDIDRVQAGLALAADVLSDATDALDKATLAGYSNITVMARLAHTLYKLKIEIGVANTIAVEHLDRLLEGGDS